MESSPIAPDPADPRPSSGELLADPAVRAPLKAVLRDWSRRDPQDAAEDARLLALALERLADERCASALAGRPVHPARPPADGQAAGSD